ncbi:AAA family ATPase [Methanospirillum stamsii]|uniref:AAA family ATPase n=1 Tax=Methanospirillum stamsii TaxID=1277351 RepID=A0A2V2MX07_9EURY|nr:AAA family ATPase [Methanospirillum stamsii]PWR72442.1 AAA family ATPase [Methanospirillum stamsii]
MTLLKIPYGISNYRTIALEGYAYVDKTRYIRILEEYPSPYQIFLRPRRFGKSLFVSLLHYYYDISEKNNFNDLFSGTEIGKDPTIKCGKYYILSFDFSGIISSTQSDLERSFFNNTRFSLQNFIERYNLPLTLGERSSAADQLTEFFSIISTRINGPIFVIIDEYDHFANELLSFHIDLFQGTISRDGFIRKWYEVLKRATKTMVDRIFVTGVSPVTLDSLTSGFNVADDLTRSPLFNEMVGFTEKELVQLIESTISSSISISPMTGLLKFYYDGYLFSEDAKERLYNSDMVLFYLKQMQTLNEAPKKLLDTNISSDYGKLSNTFRLKNPDQNYEVIKDIVSNNNIFSHLTDQFSMDLPFSKDDFKSLLFYLGLLTIRDSLPGAVSLQIPNYVIRGLYYDFFLDLIAKEAPFQIEPDRIRDAIYQIAYAGLCDKLTALIEELLHAFSNRDFIGFDEKYIKIAIFAYANMSSLYLVKSEYEVPGGYIDLALLKRDPWHPDYYALFELKYLKKSISSDEEIEQAASQGIEQLKRYTSSPELSSIPNLKKWVLVFSGDRCVRKEEVSDLDDLKNSQ